MIFGRNEGLYGFVIKLKEGWCYEMEKNYGRRTDGSFLCFGGDKRHF